MGKFRYRDWKHLRSTKKYNTDKSKNFLTSNHFFLKRQNGRQKVRVRFSTTGLVSLNLILGHTHKMGNLRNATEVIHT